MLKKSHTKQPPHKEDIKSAVRKLYSSMNELARQVGVNETILRAALLRPYPKAEAIIAQALNTTAPELWPEHYTEEALANWRHWRRLANVPRNLATQNSGKHTAFFPKIKLDEGGRVQIKVLDG